jgi:hypothetical protein
LPDFPSKMLFGNFEPEAIVERRMQLQQFFQRIPKFFYDWQEFLIFFEVNNPVVKKKPITRKINFALELGGIHLEQFPDRIVTMDKEEFLVRFFIETIRHALQELGVSCRLGVNHFQLLTSQNRKSSRTLNTCSTSKRDLN